VTIAALIMGLDEVCLRICADASRLAQTFNTSAFEGGDAARTLVRMLQLGRFEIHSVTNGTFRLDGGAMFGVVPKVLWQNITDVDDENRILLAARTLLAIDRSAGRIIVVDTGCGTKWEPKQAERFAIKTDADALPKALNGIGASMDDVTDVVVTHLHFDHNGGLADWYDEPGGPTRLRFSKARHWLHREHWKYAHSPTVKDRASFLPPDFAVLENCELVQFVEGDEPQSRIEGMDCFVSRGHTPYQLHPIFRGEGQRLIFISDIVPTIAHLRLPWVMAYDLHPLITIAEREYLYPRCLNAGWMLAFAHDPQHGGVALEGTPERPIVSRTLPL
jgi:glyoxylase-like metal-dependent hydrolase (beta-lactamase superfamily II)